MAAPVNLSTALTKTDVVVSASTTAPTLGDAAVNKFSYMILGPILHLWWSYEENTGSAAGSGTYLITLPESIQIDSDYINVGTSVNAGVVGYCSAANAAAGVKFNGVVTAYNSTNLAMVISDGDATGELKFVTDSFLGIGGGSAPVKYSLYAAVPIEGRNYAFVGG